MSIFGIFLIVGILDGAIDRIEIKILDDALINFDELPEVAGFAIGKYFLQNGQFKFLGPDRWEYNIMIVLMEEGEIDEDLFFVEVIGLLE